MPRQHTWVRTFSKSQTSMKNGILLSKLSAGETLFAAWVRWGFAGVTSVGYNAITDQLGNPVRAHLVTTVGPGTEAPPDPVDQANDVAPPTQRVLWREARGATVMGFSQSATATSFLCDLPAAPVAKSGVQVLAPSNMGVGNTLNVWFAWNFDGWIQTDWSTGLWTDISLGVLTAP